MGIRATWKKMPKEVRKLVINTIMLALGVCCILLALFYTIMCPGIFLCESGKASVVIDADTAYEGAATIAGLATFGSILSLKFSKTYEKHGSVEIGTATMLSSIVILILLQGILMFIACCGNLTQNMFAVILAVSITCLIVAILGLGHILDPSFREDRDLANGG